MEAEVLQWVYKVTRFVAVGGGIDYSCQRLGCTRLVPDPWQSLPLVNEGFAQVAIDIIGLLPV